MIEIKALSKAYNKKNQALAVDSVSTTIHEGTFVALLGQNGSGKSTLLKCITGVIKPSAGSCLINGFDSFKSRKKLIKNMGVMFSQKTSFIIDLSVKDNLNFFRSIYGIDERSFKSKIEYLDSYLDFKGLLDKPYRKLSFGERTKCEIASILLHSPKYIVLDEPTIGLDYKAKAGLYNLLADCKSNNTTCIIVTHEVDYIENVCDKVLILSDGKLAVENDATVVGKFFRDESHTLIKVNYSKVIDEGKASEISNSHNFSKTGENVFSINIPVDEKDETIKRLSQAFSLISVDASELSLRGMLENVLNKGI